MRVLVTGSAGFIGRHIVRAFVDRYDADVTCFDVKHTFGDCRILFNGDNDHVRFDLAIHAAAIVGGRAKIDGDPLALSENLELDSLFFRWAVRSRQPHLVYLSSSAVYPVYLQGVVEPDDHVNDRLHESDQPVADAESSLVGKPDRVYGWSKLVGEALAAEARLAGVRVDVVRPFSGYGHDQDSDYPFRAFIERAIDRRDPFTIWGDPFSTRDWVHVDDVVGAIVAITSQDNPYDAVNVCTGYATTFYELATIVTREVGYNPARQVVSTAPRGVMHRVGDPSRMLEFYRPRVTLEEGVRRALREPPS